MNSESYKKLCNIWTILDQLQGDCTDTKDSLMKDLKDNLDDLAIYIGNLESRCTKLEQQYNTAAKELENLKEVKEEVKNILINIISEAIHPDN